MPGVGMRWVSALHVVRGDSLAEHLTDHGPAEDFEKIQPFVMPSPDGCNTVAQLMEHADKNREDTYWFDRSKQMLAESTLVKDHLDQDAQIRELAANRSTFSPTGAHQRNGYSRRGY